MKSYITTVLLSCVIISSCSKKEDVEVAEIIPAATTPFECDGFYYTKLYDELKGESIWSTPSGNFLLPYGNKVNMVIKMDTNNKVIWQKTLGTWNGSYLVFNKVDNNKYYAQYSDDRDLVFAHVDEELNILKQVRTGWVGACTLYHPRDEGELIVKNPSFFNNTQVTQLVKFLDKDLNEVWEYKTDNDNDNSNDPVLRFFLEDDDYFYFGGSWTDKSKAFPESQDPYLVKMDKNGKVIWTKVYRDFDKTFNPEELYHLTFKGAAIEGGSTAKKIGEKEQNTYLMRLRINTQTGELISHEQNNEDVEWLKEPARKYMAHDGYFTLSQIVSPKTGKDVVVEKFDKSGNFMWKKTYGGTADESASGITTMPDGTIYLLGDVVYYDGKSAKGYRKRVITKADATGKTCY